MAAEFPAVITASLREAFSTCPQKFYLSTISGLTSPVVSIHLHFGTSYAAALEAFRTAYFRNPKALEGEARYDHAVAAGFKALILAYGHREDDAPVGGRRPTKTFLNCVRAFVEYLYNYPPAADHAPPSYGPLGPRVEFSFSFEIPDCFHPVTGDPLLYHGRFDTIADYAGLLFVMDDKTASALGPLWKHQWELRSQFTGYVHGARTNGLEIAGAIVRGMAILTDSCKTEEVITYRPDWLVQRWLKRLQYDVKRMLRCWAEGYWPHQGEESGACYSYGMCAFHICCNSATPEHFSKVYFVEGRWDPVTRTRSLPVLETVPLPSELPSPSSVTEPLASTTPSGGDSNSTGGSSDLDGSLPGLPSGIG